MFGIVTDSKDFDMQFASIADGIAEILEWYGVEIDDEVGNLFLICTQIRHHYDIMKICSGHYTINDGFMIVKGGMNYYEEMIEFATILKKIKQGGIRIEVKPSKKNEQNLRVSQAVIEDIGVAMEQHFLNTAKQGGWINPEGDFSLDVLEGFIDKMEKGKQIQFEQWFSSQNKPIILYGAYIDLLMKALPSKMAQYSQTDKNNFVGAILESLSVFEYYPLWEESKDSTKNDRLQYNNKTSCIIRDCKRANKDGKQPFSLINEEPIDGEDWSYRQILEETINGELVATWLSNEFVRRYKR